MTDEIVVQSGNAESFAEMRRIQLADQAAAQNIVKATLPKNEIKDEPDNQEQVLGTPGPSITRGQQAKLEAAFRKGTIVLTTETVPAAVPATAVVKKVVPEKKKVPAKKKAPVKKATVTKIQTAVKTVVKKKKAPAKKK